MKKQQEHLAASVDRFLHFFKIWEWLLMSEFSVRRWVSLQPRTLACSVTLGGHVTCCTQTQCTGKGETTTVCLTRCKWLNVIVSGEVHRVINVKIFLKAFQKRTFKAVSFVG